MFLQPLKDVIPVLRDQACDIIEGHGSKHLRSLTGFQALRKYLECMCFIFYQKWTSVLNERSVSSNNTIWSLATSRTTTMYRLFFELEV